MVTSRCPWWWRYVVQCPWWWRHVVHGGDVKLSMVVTTRCPWWWCHVVLSGDVTLSSVMTRSADVNSRRHVDQQCTRVRLFLSLMLTLLVVATTHCRVDTNNCDRFRDCDKRRHERGETMSGSLGRQLYTLVGIVRTTTSLVPVRQGCSPGSVRRPALYRPLRCSGSCNSSRLEYSSSA